MSQPGLRDADPPPTVHRGKRGFDHSGNGSAAAQRIDDIVSLRRHADNSAIFALSRQVVKCDSRHCDSRMTLPYGRMDNAELKRRLENKGVRNVDVARALDLHPTKIGKAFGKEGRRFTAAEMKIIDGLLDDEPQLGSLPIIGLVAASTWKEAVQSPLGRVPRFDRSIPAKAYALRVDGDSMDLIASEGAIVIVDPEDQDLYEGRLYVIQTEGGEATFKQFKTDPARLKPLSSNPTHRSLPLAGTSFQVLGRVIWHASRT